MISKTQCFPADHCPEHNTASTSLQATFQCTMVQFWCSSIAVIHKPIVLNICLMQYTYDCIFMQHCDGFWWSTSVITSKNWKKSLYLKIFIWTKVMSAISNVHAPNELWEVLIHLICNMHERDRSKSIQLSIALHLTLCLNMSLTQHWAQIIHSKLCIFIDKFSSEPHVRRVQAHSAATLL